MDFDFAKLELIPLNSPGKRSDKISAPCSIRLTTGGTGGHHNTRGRNFTITVRDRALLSSVGLAVKMNYNMSTGVLPTGERVIVMWPDRAGPFRSRASAADTFVARLGNREWMNDVADHAGMEARISVETFARGEKRLVVRLPAVYNEASDDSETEPTEADSTATPTYPDPGSVLLDAAPPTEPYTDKTTVTTVAPARPVEQPVKRGPGRPPKAKPEPAAPVSKPGPRPTPPPKKDRMMVAGNALAQAMANRPPVQAKRLVAFEAEFPPVAEPEVNRLTRELTFSNGRRVQLTNEYDYVKVVFEVIRNQARGMPSALSVLNRVMAPLPAARPSLGETKTLLTELATALEKAGVELHCSTDFNYAIRITP